MIDIGVIRHETSGFIMLSYDTLNVSNRVRSGSLVSKITQEKLLILNTFKTRL